MALAAITALLTTIGGMADKFIEDPQKRQELESKLNEARSSIIIAEANGESWLQRNWRPLIMMNFGCLITAHWLGYTPENLSETQIIALLDIIKIGLGGYIIGRSGEKITKTISPAIQAGLKSHKLNE
jgi:hypothetical protein